MQAPIVWCRLPLGGGKTKKKQIKTKIKDNNKILLQLSANISCLLNANQPFRPMPQAEARAKDKSYTFK